MRRKRVGMNKNNIKRIFSLFKTVIKVKPQVFIFEYLMMFVDAVATAALLPALSNFFAALSELIAGGWRHEGTLAYSLLTLFAIYVIAEIASGCTNYCGEIYSNLSVRGLRKKLHANLRLLPTIATENNEIMETVKGAYIASYDVRALLNTLMDFLVFYLPYFLTYALYLYRMEAKLLLLLPCLFVPLSAAQFFKAKAAVAYEQELGRSRRLEDAYTSYLQTPDIVRELRSLGADHFFGERYRDLQYKIRSLLLVRGRRSCLYDWAGELLHLLFYIAIFVLLLWSYGQGELAVHELAAIFMTLMTVRDMAAEFINSRIGEVAESYGLIKRCSDLDDYLTLQEQATPAVPPTSTSAMTSVLGMISRSATVNFAGTSDAAAMTSKSAAASKSATASLPTAKESEAALVFEDVSFTYPGNEKPALAHVSFSLRTGETLALVGENGSGKTTLSALFLGLYTPDSGKIYRNGKLLTAADELTAAADNSAVFQNFNRYRRTVRENLEFAVAGAASGANGTSAASLSAGAAVEAATDTGGTVSDTTLTELLASLQFDVEHDLQAGLATYLDPAFGGVDLSGGQWQKLALARAKLKAAQFIVLDEPTAALDPLFEAQVYNYLLALAHDKVGLIVTHRLALARKCDKIMLLQGGKPLACDTHDNLLLKSALYREMWENQALTY